MGQRGLLVFMMLHSAGVALLVRPNAAHLARAADRAKATEIALAGSRTLVETLLGLNGKRSSFNVIKPLLSAVIRLPACCVAIADDSASQTNLEKTQPRNTAQAAGTKRSAADIETPSARAPGIDGIVLTPDGKPAVKAIVALAVPDSRTRIHNGAIDTKTSDVDSTETDSSGRFHFSSELSDFYLVVTHFTGYAQYMPTAKSKRRTINLDPWTRIEGTYRAGGQPRAKTPITIDQPDPRLFRNSRPSIGWEYSTTTDVDGRFVFERVRAGRGWIGRDLVVELREKWEILSACRLAVGLPVGKTVHVDLGTTGRTVVGNFRAPTECKKKVMWSSSRLLIRVKRSKDLAPASYFDAAIGTDGDFRVDDLPPGDYTLSLFLSQMNVGQLDNYPLTIPAGAANAVAKPIDLGAITLEKER